MKNSITYYLTLFVIKLKGIKKTFDTDPIDYQKLRKDDVFLPKNSYFKKNNPIETFTVLQTTITVIKAKKPTNKVVLFVPGGAFVYGPVQHHWDTAEKISKQTGHTIWMCNYPKAPEHQITEVSQNIDEVYRLAAEKFGANKLIGLGDSAGGSLLITLTQRLIKQKLGLPISLFLISPVIDPSFSNPDIQDIEPKDPILSIKGVLSAKTMCAGDLKLNDPLLAPLEGSFEGFPETTLFIAKHDITYPDQQVFAKRLEKEKVPLLVFRGREMPHIWPLLPVMKESTMALNKLILLLKL